MMDPKDISELQHEEFYRYIAQAYDKPRFTLHYKTDAPLNIRSIFYVPEMVRCLAVHSIALDPGLTHSARGGVGVPSEELHIVAGVYLPLWCRLEASADDCCSHLPSASLVCSSSSAKWKPSQVLLPALPQWTLAALSS